ncbi:MULTISPECIES: helix-turn-helix domain-containing protein [Agathobaculum]|nr:MULTISPECIES: helix-turn-helix transcriptional regulator [Agathobaculum]
MREDSDTSQIQLAEYLKIDQRTYSNYETGKREIPVHLLIRLAQYYGVSLDYLVGLSDR